MPAPATPHRYERKGVLAVHPSAFFDFFFCGPSAQENRPSEGGEATLVTIRGPLDQHDEGWQDSYESILARVNAACAEQPEAVVLLVDSPGGDAAGCFDCAREIAAACEAAGKYLVAYVEGQACSAAYAIASVAKRVVMGASSRLGSIGVIATRPDFSAQNAERGVRISFVASGARKSDGHPDSPTTEAELADLQRMVDSMAAVFFELVSETRGLSVEAIAALQAGVFHGEDARAAGLGDETLTLRSTLASVASWIQQERDTAMPGKIRTEGGDDKDKKEDKPAEESPFDSVRTKLKEMSKGDDANARAAARALAELEKEEEQAAAGDDEKKPDESAAASAVRSAIAAAVQAQKTADKVMATLAERDERDERRDLLARNDLSKEMRALLEKAPIDLVRETIKDLGDPPPPAAGATAAQALAAQQSGTQPTQGAGANSTSALPPHEKAALDRAMGLDKSGTPKVGNVLNSPFRLTLGGAESDPKATA